MFIVMEIQKSESVSTIVNTYETRNGAEQKYHTVLAYAAVSEIPKHSAVLLNEDGTYIKSECFEHPVQSGE